MTDKTVPGVKPTGDRQMDADHDALMRLAAQVDELLATSADGGAVSAKLVALYRLAEAHFSYEDTLMAALPADRYGAHLARHAKRHADFIRLVMAISARAKGYEPVEVLRRMYGGVLPSLAAEMAGLDAELLRLLSEAEGEGEARKAAGSTRR